MTLELDLTHEFGLDIEYILATTFYGIFVYSASVLVFGLRPDVFLARYSILA